MQSYFILADVATCGSQENKMGQRPDYGYKSYKVGDLSWLVAAFASSPSKQQSGH